MGAGGIVIVGGGQAAAQLATSLRREGCTEGIVMLCAEPHPPYHRPPLSKGYLGGRVGRAQLPIRKQEFYSEQQIELRPGQRVTAIDRDARQVWTEDGQALPYRRLALACGSRVRRLPVAGDELEGVHYLRTLDDADRLVSALRQSERVVVVGGGFLGLEFAASASALGKQIVLIETAPRLAPRIGSERISEFYREQHESHGVAVHTGMQVAEFSGQNGKVREVRCTDGTVFPADLVLVSIGVIPNDELAAAAGLLVDNGVVVDQCARTPSDPAIVCAGDVAAHVNAWARDTDKAIRLESVQHATDQARTAAVALLRDDAAPYTAVPWFWSDQHGIKLQMAGLAGGFDQQIVRGAVSTAGFSVCYFRDGQLIAMDSINRPMDHAAARKLLAAGAPLTPDQAADEGCKLKSLL